MTLLASFAPQILACARVACRMTRPTDRPPASRWLNLLRYWAERRVVFPFQIVAFGQTVLCLPSGGVSLSCPLSFVAVKQPGDGNGSRSRSQGIPTELPAARPQNVLEPGCRRAAWPTERPVLAASPCKRSAEHWDAAEAWWSRCRRFVRPTFVKARISVLGLKPRAAVSENRMRSRIEDAPLAAWRADSEPAFALCHPPSNEALCLIHGW